MLKFVKFITDQFKDVPRVMHDLSKECPTIAPKRAVAKLRLGDKWLLANKVERIRHFELKG